jgi:hypothetical protein
MLNIPKKQFEYFQIVHHVDPNVTCFPRMVTKTISTFYCECTLAT